MCPKRIVNLFRYGISIALQLTLVAAGTGCEKTPAGKGSAPLTKVALEFAKPSAKNAEPAAVFIAGGPHQSDHLPFDWSVYSDPSRPEFWADGADGVLPRPFLKLAGEPTVENARRLLEWQNAQWRAIEDVIKALGGAGELQTYSDLVGENFLESLSRKDKSFDFARSSPLVKKVLAESPQEGIAWEDVGIVYIYRSKCQACQQTRPVIEAAMELGAKVIPLQINDGGVAMFENSQPYSKEWAGYFPLGDGDERVTPTLYLVIKGHEPKKAVGSLSLKDITEYVKSTLGDKHESITR